MSSGIEHLRKRIGYVMNCVENARGYKTMTPLCVKFLEAASRELGSLREELVQAQKHLETAQDKENDGLSTNEPQAHLREMYKKEEVE